MKITGQCCVAALVLGCCLSPATAQQAAWEVQRTEFGHPDLQGVWMTEFTTLWERSEGVSSLVLGAAEAAGLARTLQGFFTEGNTDPEMLWTGTLPLARVKGEYRTSVVIYPADGRMPLTEYGEALMDERATLDEAGFDGPEQRPLTERCISGLGAPPIRALPIRLPILIVQNADHVALYTEDSAGLRIIPLTDSPAPPVLSSYDGVSRGRWEGDTLVVVTTHFPDRYPARDAVPRYVLIGPDTRITERFTRVAETELHYHFEVEDARLYQEPWQGEFSFTWLGGGSYVYSCHEGNYSLPGILRGGRLEQANANR